MWFYFLIHLDVRSLRQKVFILFSNEATEKAAQSLVEGKVCFTNKA